MRYLLSLLLCAFLVSCSDVGFSPGESHTFIRRNLFQDNPDYPIGDTRAYQYGNLHVDGPSGGMLYRFQARADGVQWLIKQWSLRERTADDTLPSIVELPNWWPSSIFSEAELLVNQSATTVSRSSGVRTVMLWHDVPNRFIYFAEDYRQQSGI